MGYISTAQRHPHRAKTNPSILGLAPHPDSQPLLACRRVSLLTFSGHCVVLGLLFLLFFSFYVTAWPLRRLQYQRPRPGAKKYSLNKYQSTVPREEFGRMKMSFVQALNG